MKKKLISDGTVWEPLVGYSRAVVVDNRVYVSGTAAWGADGQIMYVGNAYGQTKRAIEKVKDALEQAGANITDVVRTRLYVTDISKWKDYCQAHQEIFEKIRPANTIVQVSAMLDKRILVEVEVEAVIGSGQEVS